MISDQQILTDVDRMVRRLRTDYPDALAVLTQRREDLTAAGMSWPDWCWLPMSAAADYVMSRPRGPVPEIATVHAITCWRLDRAVLQLQPDPVTEALAQLGAADRSDPHAWRRLPMAPIRAALLPAGLPTWCPYLLAPPLDDVREQQFRGLWVWLEHDQATDRPELRILLDRDGTRGALEPLTAYLDRPTLGRALDDTMAATHAAARGVRGANPTGLPDRLSAMLGVRIQAVLPLILGAVDRRYVYVDQDTESRRLGPPHGQQPVARTATVWEQTQLAGPRSVIDIDGG